MTIAAKDNYFKALLDAVSGDRARSIEAIRQGVPASVLKDAGAYFSMPANRICVIVRLPEATAHVLVKRGANLDSVASEGIWRLADVMTMAQAVFEDAEAAKTWLRTPNNTFQNAAPIDYLDTEPGATAVRHVLNAIATGGVA